MYRCFLIASILCLSGISLVSSTAEDPSPAAEVEDADGGSIGDFVWSDSNRNGIQDEGENGIFGVKIRLRDANETGSAPIISTTSNETGYYIFEELPYGSYVVSAENGFPLEFPNSVFDWGQSLIGMGDPEIDSNDHNGVLVVLDKDNETNLTIDFGYTCYR